MVRLRFLAAVVLAMVSFGPIALASAQLDASDGTAIRSVIEKQIEAFRRDDGEGAFAFAAPSIRAMFGTAAAFMEMVRNSYRSVYRPANVEFEDLSESGGVVAQRVHVVGPDGKPRTALFIMERQQDGSWRIAGCMLLDEPGRST